MSNICEEVVEAFVGRLDLLVGVKRQLHLFEHFVTFPLGHDDLNYLEIFYQYHDLKVSTCT